MPWSVEKFTTCLKPYAKPEEISKLLKGCSHLLPALTPEKKARLTKCLMDSFEKQFPKDVRIKVLENCGHMCMGTSIIERAKKIKTNSKTLDDLIDELNRHHIGGGKLKLKEGKIHAVYDRCYCGAVSKTKEKFSSTYCNCSRGWFLTLFEQLFEKPVKVDLLESIIQGAKTCEFVIYI